MYVNRLESRSKVRSTRRAIAAGIMGGCVAAMMRRIDAGAEVATPGASPAAADTVEWLVTVEFSGATIDGTSRRADPQAHLSIVLTTVDPTAMAFTDRPARMAAEWSLNPIIDAINDASANGDPLNANLSARIPDSMHKVGVVLTLRSAIYDHTEATVKLTADLVSSYVGESQSDRTLPVELRAGFLFIDSITANSAEYNIPQNGDPLIIE